MVNIKAITKKSLSNFGRNQRILLIALILIAVVLGLIIPVYVTPNSLYRVFPEYTYKPKDLSNEDLIATFPFSYTDEVATEEARAEAAKAVLPYFTYSLDTTNRVEEKASEFVAAFSTGRDEATAFCMGYGIEPSALISRFLSLSEDEKSIALTYLRSIVKYTMDGGVFKSEDVIASHRSGYDSVTLERPSLYGYEPERSEVKLSDVETDLNVYNAFSEWYMNGMLDLSSDVIGFLFYAAESLVEPNVFYDLSRTENLRADAEKAVEPVRIVINEGDYLLRKDSIVTEQQLRTIKTINGTAINYTIPEYIGRALFLIVVTLAAVFAVFSMIDRPYRIPFYTFFLLFGFLITLAFTFFVVFYALSQDIHAVTQFLPFLVMPLLLTSLMNKKRFGFIEGLLYAAYMMFMPTSNSFTFFYIVIMVQISIMVVSECTTRLDYIANAFEIMLLMMFTTLVFHMIEGRAWVNIPNELLVVAINSLFSCLIADILLPIIDDKFNIPSKSRLKELSDSDNPLLREMKDKAEGTFNHASCVSDMAYEACKAIGANAELAKTGALFHDVGKSDQPQYFIENQPSGYNVHNDINDPLISVSYIRAHVPNGVRKVQERNFPREVVDIVAQHHGNDVISFFYKKAKEINPNVSDVKFRYDSDIPRSKEAAVVMLADVVEAATKSMSFTPEEAKDKDVIKRKYLDFMDRTIINKLKDGQLDGCTLTTSDFSLVKAAFLKVLLGRDHHRISYDVGKDSKQGGGK